MSWMAKIQTLHCIYDKEDSMIKNPTQILLVEDNPGDIELTREAFEQSPLSNQFHVTRDGDEALDAQ